MINIHNFFGNPTELLTTAEVRRSLPRIKITIRQMQTR